MTAGGIVTAGGTVKAGGRAKKTSVALLAASMVLAACGGGAKPDSSASRTTGSPPTTTAAAPTTPASPTATADPNIPAAARAHTPAGAEAFVRYFYSQLNIAWTTPRAGILSPLCQASAVACTANEQTATRLAKEGHHYNGNPITVVFIGALDSAAKNQLGILANVIQERRSEVDAAGKTYITDQRKNLRLHFELLYTSQAWSVASTKLVN